MNFKLKNMNILYHYTSVEAFFNMLEKSVFVDQETGVRYFNMWATHVKYLNDETERKLYVDMFLEKGSEYFKMKGSSLSEEQQKDLKTFCDEDLYIISLSENQDDLDMWRCYGGDGIGVNIGFDFSNRTVYNCAPKASAFKMEQVYNVCKCDYFREGDCCVDNSLVEKIYNHYTDKSNGLIQPKVKVSLDIMREIQDRGVLLKHCAYKEEREWRIVCKSSYFQPKHAYKNGIIKPYIEFKIPLSTITSITIGPCIKDEYAVMSIEDFVRRRLCGVSVNFSEIPYRR